jgi:general secretion pathway protein D
MKIRTKTAILCIGLLLCLASLPGFSARAAATQEAGTGAGAEAGTGVGTEAGSGVKTEVEAGAKTETAPPTKVTINFQDVEIGSVIASISKITNRTFIVDPRVKGKVTIISTREVPIKDVYGIFLAILQVHDFAAVEDGGVIKIIPLDQAKHDAWGPLSRPNSKTPADSMVTSLFPLQYVAADRLVAILRPLLPPKSYMAAQPDSNTLIITDRAGNVIRLREIISQLDQARTGEIEVVRLLHAAADDVVQVINNLEGPAGKAPTGAETSALRLIADERTNSVVLSGSEGARLRVRALISHLDTPIEAEGDTQVVFLKYARAKDMTPLLAKVEPAAEKAPGAPPTAPARLNSNNFDIQADEATNALIITAPPATMKSLLAVIRKLDIRRPQVMIEAVIAEILTGKGAELGVQWRATDLESSKDSGVLGGTNFNKNSSPNINILSAAPLDAQNGFGSLTGFNMGYLKGSINILGEEILNLGALVSALATDGDSNILSTPSLVTMDNQEAEIVVGQNVPFATGSYTGAGGSTTPQNPFTTYERQDVGLKLKVTPQVNEGDTIRLDIEQEVSNLSSGTTSTETIGLQTTSTRSIKTSVQVDDGRVLVLGGLISDDIQESVQKVPFLGDIPFLGWLFSYTSTSHNKRNLMVFLRPTILRDLEQGSRITFDKYDYMRRLQIERNREGVALLPQVESPVMPELEEEQP